MRSIKLARAAAAAILLGIWLTVPATTLGTVSGGCTATGTSTSGGVDITTATEWHLKSTDVAGGSGTAPSKMTSAQVGAAALGLSIPVAGGSGDGDTAGSVDGISVEPYAILGHRFTVAGSASGEGAPCSGQIVIILDDVDPLFTVLGGGGILAALIGLIVILAVARSQGGAGMAFIALLFGFLGGAGLGLALEQFGILDPTGFVGLAIAIGVAVLGLILNGRLRSSATAT